jgi:hypothetical protein
MTNSRNGAGDRAQITHVVQRRFPDVIDVIRRHLVVTNPRIDTNNTAAAKRDGAFRSSTRAQTRTKAKLSPKNKKVTPEEKFPSNVTSHTLKKTNTALAKLRSFALNKTDTVTARPRIENTPATKLRRLDSMRRNLS